MEIEKASLRQTEKKWLAHATVPKGGGDETHFEKVIADTVPEQSVKAVA